MRGQDPSPSEPRRVWKSPSLALRFGRANTYFAQIPQRRAALNTSQFAENVAFVETRHQYYLNHDNPAALD